MTVAGSSSLRPVGLAGLGWGALLLWRGPQLFRSVEGRPPSQGERDAVTVLGLRHAAQGLAQLVAPHHLGRLYAAVDVLHMVSMVAVAVAAPVRRRSTLLSGTVAALAGVASARADRR